MPLEFQELEAVKDALKKLRPTTYLVQTFIENALEDLEELQEPEALHEAHDQELEYDSSDRE